MARLKDVKNTIHWAHALRNGEPCSKSARQHLRVSPCERILGLWPDMVRECIVLCVCGPHVSQGQRFLVSVLREFVSVCKRVCVGV